jgi:hypothetical protein
MQGSGGFLTKYSFGVCRVRWSTSWIFINWARWIGIEYLIVGIVGIVGLSRSELNIQ